MKKASRLLMLLCVLTALLCVSAMAANEPTSAGIYGITSDPDVTIEAKTASGASITPTTIGDYTGFCALGEKLAVSYAGAADNAFYLLIVTNKATTAPTAADIVYIDQQTADSGVSFTAYPSALGKGEYYVYLSSNAGSGLGSGGLEQIGSFKGYVPYKLGDVNNDGKITTADAVDILWAVTGKKELDGTQTLAANVNGDEQVDVTDATYILKFIVGQAVPYDLSND